MQFKGVVMISLNYPLESATNTSSKITKTTAHKMKAVVKKSKLFKKHKINGVVVKTNLTPENIDAFIEKLGDKLLSFAED